MPLLSTPTVSEYVKERPYRSKLFEKYGISYCSSGTKSLDEACAARGIDPGYLLAEMHCIDEAHDAEADEGWKTLGVSALCDHIENTHHAYLRESLPRLAKMLTKVHAVHGHHRTELAQVVELFFDAKAELEAHMAKEEQVLFPMLRQLDQSAIPPRYHCGTVRNPICAMTHEHSDVLRALEEVRELTRNYAPPEGACATYCAMLDGLAEFHADMQVHIQKEDEVLFPRGAELEEKLRLQRPGVALQG